MARIGFSPSIRSWSRYPAIAQVRLVGDGKTTVELRTDLDWTTQIGQGKPTFVKRGVFSGFSFPVFATNEELFLEMHIPLRWDAVSDISCHLHCYLVQAENSHFFKFEMGYYTYTPGTDIVADTILTAFANTATGAGADQYQSYEVDIDIPYAGIEIGDSLGLRLRRKAATGPECDGDIVVTHVGLRFNMDKFYYPAV